MEIVDSILITSKRPSGGKPKITIQDSYLSFYFGIDVNQNSNNIGKLKENVLRTKMKNFIQNDNYTNSSLHSEINIEKKFKYLGRKTKHERKELDPLDATTVRGYKGNFISLERRPQKNIIPLQINTIASSEPPQNKIEITPSENTHKNSQIISAPSTTIPKREEIQLIPQSIKNKMKK